MQGAKEYPHERRPKPKFRKSPKGLPKTQAAVRFESMHHAMVLVIVKVKLLTAIRTEKQTHVGMVKNIH